MNGRTTGRTNVLNSRKNDKYFIIAVLKFQKMNKIILLP